MALSIRKKVPDDYKFVFSSGSIYKSRLNSKGQSFICSLVNFRNGKEKLLHFEVKASNEDLVNSCKEPNGYTKRGFLFFHSYIVNLTTNVNAGLESKDETYLDHMPQEYVYIPFWINEVLDCINPNKYHWDETSDLLYALCQILYESFTIYSGNVVQELEEKKNKKSSKKKRRDTSLSRKSRDSSLSRKSRDKL